MSQAPRDGNQVPTMLAVDDTTGETVPVAVDADGNILVVLSGAGSGDVVGPGSATDNAVARFDGTTGQLIQNSTVLIGDTGAITGVLSVTGVAGGSSITGGTGASDALTLRSTSNATKGIIALNDQGGNVTIGGAATASELRFLEPSGSGTNYTAFKAKAQTADITYTLPDTIGAAGTFLKDAAGNGVLSWAAPAGGGDVVGPGSSTDNAIVRWNGTGGTSVQNSGVTVDDSNNIQVPNGSKIFIGTSDTMVVHGATITSQLQLNDDTQGIEEVHSHSSTAGNAAIYYGARSRGTTASPTIVSSGDTVRIDSAVAYDGTDYEALGFTSWTVDGTPGSNDMPGKYIIAVTPDGGFTPATALTITNDKAVALTGALSVTGHVTFEGVTSTGATGSGALVFATSPTLVTPTLGVASATSINKVAITAPATSATLTIADGKTLTVNNTITLAGTDATTMTFPTTSATLARTDAANTFTGASTASAWVLTSPTITTSIVPTSNDGAALGSTTNQFSDLFLAEGGVINFDNGDATITQTGNDITIAGITTFGVGTSTAVTLGTIELGAASDTTISRVSAGVAAIEGVNILTVAGGTMTGSITLGENTSIALDPAGSADGKFTGITITATAGYTQAFGDLVYLDPTDSRWEATDANAASGADGDARGILGMVVVAGTDGNACTILLNGVIRADAKFPTFTVNNPIYVSETAGLVTQTQPTTTDVVIRIVGAALTADEMYFNPDNTWVTHT